MKTMKIKTKMDICINNIRSDFMIDEGTIFDVISMRKDGSVIVKQDNHIIKLLDFEYDIIREVK